MVLIKYVTKQEFNKIVNKHFKNSLSNVNLDVVGYNYLDILYSEKNEKNILWDFIADETEEEYNEHKNHFKALNDYIIGGYFDVYNNILFCTDIQFKPNNADNLRDEFINYLLNKGV